MKANPKTSQMQKVMIKEKHLIDYVYYVFFVMLKNAVGDTGTLVSIWKSSKSGIILHATLTIGGFLVFEYYLSTFLSSLTVPYYEKPIETIPGKYFYLCKVKIVGLGDQSNIIYRFIGNQFDYLDA